MKDGASELISLQDLAATIVSAHWSKQLSCIFKKNLFRPEALNIAIFISCTWTFPFGSCALFSHVTDGRISEWVAPTWILGFTLQQVLNFPLQSIKVGDLDWRRSYSHGVHPSFPFQDELLRKSSTSFFPSSASSPFCLDTSPGTSLKPTVRPTELNLKGRRISKGFVPTFRSIPEEKLIGSRIFTAKLVRHRMLRRLAWSCY